MSEKKSLNPNAKLWVEALRSGKYKQGRVLLASSEGYCCLGVACELAVAAGIVSRIEHAPGNIGYRSGDIGAAYHALPPVVARWLELTTANGRFNGTFVIEDLASLNDSGVDFHIIADIIESQPPGLFL